MVMPCRWSMPAGKSRSRRTCTMRFAVVAPVFCFAMGAMVPVALAQQGASAPTASSPAPAGSAIPTPVADVLLKIQLAARRLDYTGVFTYQQHESIESSRISHVVEGKDERERIEVLDGDPLEYVRLNDEVQCLMPGHRTVLIERQRADRFPGLLLSDAQSIDANYAMNVLPDPYRVAGRECRQIEIRPRDAHRYGYRLCADRETDLLLKAQTIANDGNVLEQISFTQIDIGGPVAASLLAPGYATKDWTLVRPEQKPVNLADLGWRIPAPPGYVSTLQVSRVFSEDRPVNQLVLSDGLSTISIFIEPYQNARSEYHVPGAARIGSVNVFGIKVANFWLTALGEVPAGTLAQLAQSIQYVQSSGTR